MAELNIEARTENLEKVLAFIGEILDEYNCSLKVRTQLDIAVEELFVNIARYAYHSGVGAAAVRVEVQEDPLQVAVTFIDNGVPYDPLAKADPDVTLSAEDRKIGGLGIYMVKKSMDMVDYEYKDGKNILTIQKKL
ncbi:MAG: ATP-binding protein [Oscillibacter sp.]|nr:ATP-binding protein [Oscillibacter sp.]